MSMQIFFFAISMYEKIQSQKYFYRPCVADVLMFLSWKLYLGVIISTYVILITYMIIDAKNNYNYIIKYKSRGKLFFENIKESFIFEIILTIYCVVSIIIWSKILGFEDIVWDKYDSNYFLSIHSTTNIAFNTFVIKYSVIFLFIICIVSLVAVICSWIGSRLLAIILCLSFFIIDFYMQEHSIIDYILISYEEIDLSIQNNIIYGAIVLIIGSLIGCILAMRKEFYGNH